MYTQLSNETISELLTAHYAVGELAYAVGIAQGVENSNYLLGLDAQGAESKAILTLYEKRMDPAQLPFFLGLMQHVAQAGVQCPLPIARRDGGLISEVSGKPAALVSFLSGKSRTVLKPEHCAEVGAALARLHGATAGFDGHRPNALSLDGWQALSATIAPRLDEIQHGLRDLVQDELAYLEPHWSCVHGLPHGIIHADLFPDNVFFTGDAVSGIIDFYFACDDALAYDLAITLNAWCFEGRECNLSKARLLVKRYTQHRPLSDAERQAFPLLLRGAALRFLLTRAYDLLHHEKSALVTPKDPLEYVAKLKFHRGNADAAFCGL